ncbi:MAG: hypothetical protein ACTSPM_04765 [Candidatus Heimdallarchaeota archaeon]
MKELYLHCDSPCLSCPTFGRMLKITSFQQRKLLGVYFCNHCQVYSLCKMGIAQRRDNGGNLQPLCTKCSRYLTKVSLSYEDGQEEKPFTEKSFIVIRKPTGSKFKILKTLKANYFVDLADILLFVLTEIGSGYYNLVEYNPITNSYKTIFTGFLDPNKVTIKKAYTGLRFYVPSI